MNKQREKLIELIRESHEFWLRYVDECAFNQMALSFSFEQMFADHILADEEIKHAFELLKAEKEGRLIVPPCKVGDKVYRLKMSQHTKRIAIEKTEVERIAISFDKTQVFCKGYAHSPATFGRTLFLSREDAEKALKGVE